MHHKHKFTLKILSQISVFPAVLVILTSLLSEAAYILLYLPLVVLVHVLVWLPALKVFRKSPGAGWLVWTLLSQLMGSTMISIPFMIADIESAIEIWGLCAMGAYYIWFVNVPVSLVSCWIVHHHTRKGLSSEETPMNTPLDIHHPAN